MYVHVYYSAIIFINIIRNKPVQFIQRKEEINDKECPETDIHYFVFNGKLVSCGIVVIYFNTIPNEQLV